MGQWFDISRSSSSMIRGLHDYWSSRCAANRLPRREEITGRYLDELLEKIETWAPPGARPGAR